MHLFPLLLIEFQSFGPNQEANLQFGFKTHHVVCRANYQNIV